MARHTVEKRLRDIEEALGRPLGTCLAELEVALRLQAIIDDADTNRRYLSGDAPSGVNA